MVDPGEAITSTSTIENLRDATLVLIEHVKRGVQTYISIDEPALSTGEWVARMVRLLGKTPPSWHISLSIATPIAKVSDLAADITGIDFPITAARISDVQPLDEF